jgi:hypothetical protein
METFQNNIETQPTSEGLIVKPERCSPNNWVNSTDPETGLPYPIAPVWNSKNHVDSWEDRHHAAYQSLDPRMVGEAGRSVRHSRIQIVPRWLHNRYHSFYHEGIQLPSSELDKFCFAVLACAGVIPNKAIDVSGQKPKLVNIDSKGYGYYRRNNRIHPEVKINKHTHEDDYAKYRGIFFMKYILENNLETISPELLERFLETDKNHNFKKRTRLGWLIVAKAIEGATEPITPIYKKAQELGMLDRTCPTDPRQVIKKTITYHPPNYFDELEKKAGVLLGVA